MPTTLRTLVKIASTTGLPRDDIMNTFHFQSDAVDRMDDVLTIETNLIELYLGLDGNMSSRIQGGISFDTYDLIDTTPRSSLSHFTSTLSPGSGFGLPNEVAICVSFRGALGSGIDPKRHRGRVFIGPLDGGVVDDGTGDTILEAGLMSAIAGNFETFMGNFAESSCAWAVFSPTNAGPPPWSSGDLLVATDPVVAGWVDNAFDTIRSRGAAATARSVWP